RRFRSEIQTNRRPHRSAARVRALAHLRSADIRGAVARHHTGDVPAEPDREPDIVLRAVAVYYDDLVLLEPKLLSMYDEILPQIDRALGESRADKRAGY